MVLREDAGATKFGFELERLGVHESSVNLTCQAQLRRHTNKITCTMAEPEKDFEKLRAEQEKDDADVLADLDKESKEFDKVIQNT